MKKIVIIVLSLTMLCTMGVSGFAQGILPRNDDGGGGLHTKHTYPNIFQFVRCDGEIATYGRYCTYGSCRELDIAIRTCQTHPVHKSTINIS